MEENSRFLPLPRGSSDFDPKHAQTTLPSTPHAHTRKSKQPGSGARTPEQEDILLDSYIEKEYKKIITSHALARKGDKGWRRFAGLVFAVLSALCTGALLLLCGSLETELHPHSKVHQKVLLWSFVVTALLGGLIFFACLFCVPRGHNVSLCSLSGVDGRQFRRRNWILLMLVGFLCSGALYLRFSSLNYVKEYEAAALLNAEPLLVLILGHFCVRDAEGEGGGRERCGLLSIMAALMTLGGAATFAWSWARENSAWELSSADLKWDIGMALGSLLSHAATTTILRIIRAMQFSVILAWIGVSGLILTLVTFIFDGHLTLSVPATVSEALHFGGIGVLTFGALFFFVLALKYEQAAAVSVMLSLDIVLLYLGKVAFADADFGWDAFRIIGGAALLISVALVAVRKYLLTRPRESTNHHSRNRCWSII